MVKGTGGDYYVESTLILPLDRGQWILLQCSHKSTVLITYYAAAPATQSPTLWHLPASQFPLLHAQKPNPSWRPWVTKIVYVIIRNIIIHFHCMVITKRLRDEHTWRCWLATLSHVSSTVIAEKASLRGQDWTASQWYVTFPCGWSMHGFLAKLQDIVFVSGEMPQCSKTLLPTILHRVKSLSWFSTSLTLIQLCF